MKTRRILPRRRLVCGDLVVARFAANAAVVALFGATSTMAAPFTKDDIAARLTKAYPDHVAGIENNEVIFKKGSSLPFDDGKGDKPFDAWLAAPDIEDMFRFAYPAGLPDAPAPADDPGRARNSAFFAKIYGDCAKGETAKTLVSIPWLPGKSQKTIEVTSINGVAEKFKAVAAELAKLPARFDVDLMPSAGGYVCRDIAGTTQASPHGYGIAIDIALKHSNYWRWDNGARKEPAAYRNAIPMEIVAVFEKHGFIWGGRWRHYDTMHFEYRPELLSGGATDAGASTDPKQ